MERKEPCSILFRFVTSTFLQPYTNTRQHLNTMENDANATPDYSKQSGTSALDEVTNLTVAELRRKRERERYASLSTEQKQARLQKNRKYKQHKKQAGRVPLSDITNYPSFGATQNCVGTVSPKVIKPHQPILTPRRLPFTLDDNVFDSSPHQWVSTEATTAPEIPSLGTVITDSNTPDLKRKRTNNWYNSLPSEQKDAYLQINQECRKKKDESKHTYQTPPQSAPIPTPPVFVLTSTLQVSQVNSNCLNQPTPQGNDMLHISAGHEVTLGIITNLTPIELTWKHARERYVALSADDKEARLQKMREYYQQKKSTVPTHGKKSPPPVITPSCLSFIDDSDNIYDTFVAQPSEIMDHNTEDSNMIIDFLATIPETMIAGDGEDDDDDESFLMRGRGLCSMHFNITIDKYVVIMTIVN
uniref:Uncharacterized protein n=1 Tax=Oryza punctata TaxID=4537 RepID=A0A0E0LTK7_ORYPU